MQYAEDFDSLLMDTIGNDVWEFRENEFACSLYPPWPSPLRHFRQGICRADDPRNNAVRSGWI